MFHRATIGPEDAFKRTMRDAQKNHLYTESKVTELAMMSANFNLAEYTKDSLATSMLKGVKDRLTITETENILDKTFTYKADVYVFSEEELIKLLADYRSRLEGVIL